MKLIKGIFLNILSKIMQYFIIIFTFIMNKLGRYRMIKDRIKKEDYLERYYIFLKDRGDFPFNIFLHKFIKSDPDDLHDHPWSYRTFILAGGYWEYLENGKKYWRGPFSYRYAPANTFHRIELDPNIPYCWTIFIPGKKVREWGFKTSNGWVNNEEYLTMKKKI